MSHYERPFNHKVRGKASIPQQIVKLLDNLRPIEVNNLKSSNVESFVYNPIRKTMVVKFKNGREYRYKNVPRSTLENFIASDSKGKFIWENMRNKYPFNRIKSNPDIVYESYMKGIAEGYEDAMSSYKGLFH